MNQGYLKSFAKTVLEVITSRKIELAIYLWTNKTYNWCRQSVIE